MPRCQFACTTLIGMLVCVSPAGAVDYFWQNSVGGAFDEPSHWLPFTPPGTQGPGGPNDTVNFDLGVAPSSRYVVTDAGRENDRLIVHDDSLELTIFINHGLLNTGGANPSLVVGAANGDTGDLILSSGGASVLETRVTSIGHAVGSTGILTIDNLEWVGTNVRVGHEGTGTLTIDNDSVASGNNAFVGNQASAHGEFNVLNDATWTSSGDVIVGRFGSGEMNVDFRGSVTSTNGTLGEDAAAAGIVFVDNGSSWTIADTLTVGESGFGLLANIFSDVVCHDAFVGRLAGSDGESHVSNNGATWTVTGRLSIGGDAFTGTAGGTGLVAINAGATTTVDEDIVVFPDGELRLGGGTLSTPEISFNGIGGLFQWNSGTLLVEEFIGSELRNEGGVLAARPDSNTITISGEYSQGSAGTLSIEIAGTAASNQYDALIVGNTAFLDGELEIRLADLFQPGPNEVYTIMDALNFAGAGSFANVASGQRLDVASGLGSFLVHYGAGSPFDPSQVVLSSFQLAILTGDYNGNGVVDAADYIVWRDHLGQTFSLTGENPAATTPGVVDEEDYNFWKSRFGQTAAGGSGADATGSVSAVPEPASLVVLSLAAIAVSCFRRRS